MFSHPEGMHSLVEAFPPIYSRSERMRSWGIDFDVKEHFCENN